MTFTAPEYPLSLPDALQHLRDALGANYGAETDEPTLTRALGVDAVVAPTGTDGAARVHPRPWATAARLIRDNTEYEVDKGLAARIDRKLQGLERQQQQGDAQAGITAYLPGTGDDERRLLLGQSGSVPTEGVW